MADRVQIALTLSDGRVARTTVMLLGRFPSPPVEGGWRDSGTPGLWMRSDSDANLQAEVDKLAAFFAQPRILNKSGEQIPGVTVVSWRRLSEDEAAAFDVDREYRDALRDTGAGVRYDMEHAREIHRNRLRLLRAPKLADLDVAWMREMESPTEPGRLKEISTEKQRLRDITACQAISDAKTIADLRAVTLDNG